MRLEHKWFYTKKLLLFWWESQQRFPNNRGTGSAKTQTQPKTSQTQLTLQPWPHQKIPQGIQTSALLGPGWRICEHNSNILCKQLDCQTQHIWHSPERAQPGKSSSAEQLGHQKSLPQPQQSSKSSPRGLAQPCRAHRGFLTLLKRAHCEVLLTKKGVHAQWQSGKGHR